MRNIDDKIIAECSYCGNTTPHILEHSYTHLMLFDENDEGKKLYEDYTWLSYSCGTCGCLNFYGDFFKVHDEKDLKRLKLYPKGSGLLPSPHMLSPSNPVPKNILKIYEEVWPLRHKAPSAFVGQVRRLLEFICVDKKASGKNLYAKLKDLIDKDVFPGYFENITDLLRKIGNIGVHASDENVDIWDAELIDDFFRFVVEYTYIAPAKIKRLNERIKYIS